MSPIPVHQTLARRARPANGMYASWMLALATLLPASTGALGQSLSFGPQSVGATSGEQNVTIRARTAGTVAAVEVLTLGVNGLDFVPGIGAMTCGSATLVIGAPCIESVMFTPGCPGLRMGAVVLLNSNSNVLGITYLNGIGMGGLGALVPGNILPVAGDGTSTGPVFDGNIATSASLNLPTGIALDGAGNMYIADQGHNRIRKVIGSTGVISTLAGNGTRGYAGNGLPSTNAAVRLNAPSSVALDGAGNLYIADTGNNVVRMIAASTGIITTVAGNRSIGDSDAGRVGDNGLATAANLNQPQGVSVDGSGNPFIADTANHRIRRVDAFTGIITTLAGNGSTDAASGAGGYAGDGGPASQAELNFPMTVAFDSAGSMYIPDSANNVVRVVTAVNGGITANSIIITFAGNGTLGDSGDGGSATQATLFSPSGVIVDAAGNANIADTGNSSIRKVGSATGFISTIAQNNTGAYVFNNGGPYVVNIWAPVGLILDGGGNLYFADSENMRIREIQSSFGVLDYVATPTRQGDQSATQSMTIENDGNAPLDLTAITSGNNAALDGTATTCLVGGPSLAVSADCAVGAIFAPSVAADPLFGQVMVSGESFNSPLDIELIGDASLVNSTTTALTSSANPSGFGQIVIFAATVNTGALAGKLTGSVAFMDGANPLGTTAPVNSSGVATLQVTTLAVGLHAIAASYGGDSTHFSSASATVTQAVLEATSTSLASSLDPSAPGQALTFTAAVTASGGGGVTPGGTLTFTDGDFTLSTVPLGAGGIESFTTTTLANGLHSITATYNGDAAHQISTSISNLVRQHVLVGSQIAVVSTPDPSSFGSPVTSTATATSNGSAAPTGTVNILDGGTLIGTATLAGSAVVGSTSAGSFITASLAVGSHTITAAYQGDVDNTPSVSAAIIQVVEKAVVPAQTSTMLSAVPNPVTIGATVSLTASVQAAKGTATITGTVSFTDMFNGAAVTLGSTPLVASGTAAINPTLALGSHSILATYGGDTNDAGSASTALTVTVLPAVTVPLATTSTVLFSWADPSAAESAVTFTATVITAGGASTGSVSFLADGASIGNVPLNANGVATVSAASLSPGTHSIVAVYSGNATHAPSRSLAISQVVDLIPTTTALVANAAAGAVNLVASASGNIGPVPSGTVTFQIGTSTLGTSGLNASGAAALSPNLAAGTYTIVAAYGGDALHSPSTSKPILVTEAISSFNVTVTPSIVTMAASQTATATVNLASTGDFADTIALACAELPTGITCQFSNPNVSLAADGIATAQLTIITGAAVASNSSAGDFNSERRSVSLGCLFLPLGVFFGCLFGQQRMWRRRPVTGALLLSFCVVGMSASGCTGVHLTGKASGTYIIQVTGTGVSSDVVKSQNVTLNITQ